MATRSQREKKQHGGHHVVPHNPTLKLETKSPSQQRKNDLVAIRFLSEKQYSTLVFERPFGGYQVVFFFLPKDDLVDI
jgi:hypothetical protein